ncbi:hypothetical protein [Klebsiella pneumoniae]|uniref:hypothetical protein n=1 Tax=Klebsiella pneumoniae TaxID=573 RepID=UPI0004E22B31|nr:hypothetical protein [Klebsiella pneumoniae]HBY8185580.1 hypothetical protein [Klebsiella pneumoniae]
MAITTEKDLGDAINRGESTIEISGDLAKKTLRIKATGAVAWAVAIGAISISFYAAMLTIGSGGTTAPVAGPVVAGLTAGSAGILGVPTTISAISLAVSAGSLGVLKKLRTGYNITKKEGDIVILTKK